MEGFKMSTRIYENHGHDVGQKYLAVTRHGTRNGCEYSIIIQDEIIKLSEMEIRDFASTLSEFFIKDK
jgi:hypothetical protein